MEIHRTYTVGNKKLNPASILVSELLKMKLEMYQIQRCMKGRKAVRLLNLLEEVKKSGKENKARTFIEWADALPQVKKPKQKRLFPLKRPKK